MTASRERDRVAADRASPHDQQNGRIPLTETQLRRLGSEFASHFLLLVSLSALLCLAGRSAGAEQLITGEGLILTRSLLGAVSSDSSIDLGRGPGSADDPVLHGGSLRVLSVEGDVFDTTYALPADHWRYLTEDGETKGYRFLSGGRFIRGWGRFLRDDGPIRFADVKAGEAIRIFGAARRLEHTLGGDPSPVRLVLTLGGEQYCMSFGGTTQLKGHFLFTARDSEAPDVCPLAYNDDSRWLCRPGQENDQCLDNDLDATVILPDLSTSLDPAEPGGGAHRYDCFYVYPTVYVFGAVGNHTDFSNISFELDPLLSHAGRFRSQCRIFAPLYRQVTLPTFGAPNAAEFLDIAYRDVRDAFRLYLKNYNGGRPFVVMGHSQGTFMLTRLIQEEIDPSPELREQMIVALLIGGDVTVPQGGVVGGSFQNIPLCESPEQTGCVIAYRTYAEGYPPALGSNTIGGAGMDTACTNPAALGGGEGTFSETSFSTFNRNPIFNIVPNPGIPTPYVLYPELYTGECVKDSTNHSYLEIRVRPGPEDQRANPVPFGNLLLSPAFLGTHILDYAWPLGELLDLVQTKADQMGPAPCDNRRWHCRHGWRGRLKGVWR